MGDALIVYAARMASLAVRLADYRIIEKGLIALTLDADLVEPRDVYAPLCLLCDAAQRLDQFDAEAIKSILSRSVPARLKFTCKYVDTRVGLTTPKMMGFLPTGSSTEFLYSSTAKS